MKGPQRRAFKAWSGRLGESPHGLAERFSSSIRFDQRLALLDIEGSMAHCKMLVKQKIIPKSDGAKILKGLEKIRHELDKGRIRFTQADEDIHMAIERLLTEEIGPAGGRLHTARSRNDQVVLDVRMYLRQELDKIHTLIAELQKSIAELARRHCDTVMPGYTHLQRAQPVLFAHYLLSYRDMLERDKCRLVDCRQRVDVMPLGSGALAGTEFSIDREYVAKLLHFAGVTFNSMDAVSDRDFIVEFVSAAAILAMHLSRIAEDWILWSTAEFDFIEIPDAFCTGSSMMPQKKNPDVLELVRGKTARVYGNLVTLLTLLKGLPMTYNRDLQEDKEPLFDTVDTVKSSLEILCMLVPKLRVKREKMLAAAGGLALATDVADYLAKKGLPFRESHNIVARLVNHSLATGKSFAEIPLEVWRSFSPLFQKDILAILSPEKAVLRRRSFGGTSPEDVERRLKEIGA